MTSSGPPAADPRPARPSVRIRAAIDRLRARLGPRGTIAAAGAVGLVVIVGLAIVLGGPGPVPASSAAPTGGAVAPTPTPAASAVEPIVALPTPATTDTVLLVAQSLSLSAREAQWLADLRSEIGKVDTLAYAEATLDRLRAYFVVVVIDQSADLDVATLSAAYHAGMTVHLVGPASAYRDQVAAVAP